MTEENSIKLAVVSSLASALYSKYLDVNKVVEEFDNLDKLASMIYEKYK